MRNIFTVDIDGTPTLTFDAPSIDEACGIVALPEFRSDLIELTSEGKKVCRTSSHLNVRIATQPEAATFEAAVARSPANDDSTFVFLIKIENVVLSVIVHPER